MNQIIFESSSAYVILCLLAGIGYAFLLYTIKHPWSKQLNWILFSLRLVLVFFLSFLLLGPIIKQINNLYEKSLIVILQDNSASIKEATDSVSLKNIQQQLRSTQEILTGKGYDVKNINLSGDETNAVQYNASSSDLNAALKKISDRYEGRKIDGVIFLSDGIYNAGLSPLHASYNFPVHTLGIGDTTQKVDIAIKNMEYNKIAYQGNKFPLRIEVLLKGTTNQSIAVTLSHHGKQLEKQLKNSASNPLLIYDFQVLAGEQGIQKVDINVEVKPGESNINNNHASAFIEVVEGKKKILLIAPAPHPDIKALREVVDKNSNYEFLLHIPGLTEQPASMLRPDKIDLAILYQTPDVRAKTRDLFQQFAASQTPLLLMLGQQSDLAQLVKFKMPLKFTISPRDYDEVTPSLHSNFTNFTLDPEINSTITDYPPVTVHFGNAEMPLNATKILVQRVGSLTTDKPLLVIAEPNMRKIAIMFGEGFWRWRLNEYDRTENTEAFDQLFGKLIQYLSTSEDKRKFRSYPVKQEFSNTEPVIFESQVYNDIFEPVYGNTIELHFTDDAGKKTQYTYVINPGNSRYQIGGLKEGVYRYKAKTSINGKTEEVKGEFVVVERENELQNLTADFDLLRKLSANTGGNFYLSAQLSDLQEHLQKTEPKSIIHSEEIFNSIINLKWIFFFLLILVSMEWFLRKYSGSY